MQCSSQLSNFPDFLFLRGFRSVIAAPQPLSGRSKARQKNREIFSSGARAYSHRSLVVSALTTIIIRVRDAK